MNKNKLKSYASAARRAFIQAVTDRAHFWGLSEDRTEPTEEKGDVAIIGGRPFPRQVAGQRGKLEERVKREGFLQVMEATAYTWFNRFLALRYMELHGYLEHGFRVLSNPNGGAIPEILDHAAQLEIPGLDRQQAINLKLDGGKDAELYRVLLVAQCNALHNAMPFLFEKIDDETELLLPDNLLHSDSLLRRLVTDIDEEDWQEVEIIGWLYQFYISEKKAQVIGKVVKSEDIPAATQLFTPNWIVKYMVQNSLGRLWLATYPDSPLRQKMEYYIEPAKQTEEVQAQLKAITPASLDPESLSFLDPAGGSGHILVEAYDIFKEIYLERGYSSRDFPRLILEKNLYGLDIDDRAAQMAGFALLMKARKDDRRILQNGNPPRLNVMAIQGSEGLDAKEIAGNLLDRTTTEVSKQDIAELVELFRHGKTFGSLITVAEGLAEKLPALSDIVTAKLRSGDMFARQAAEAILPFAEQARILARKYDCVVANPPYINSRNMPSYLRSYIESNFVGADDDVFAAFVCRAKIFARKTTKLAFVTPFTWMYLFSYADFRKYMTENYGVASLIQLEYNAFEPACVPVCTFVCDSLVASSYSGYYIDLSDFKGAEAQPAKTLEAITNPKSYWIKKFDISIIKRVPGFVFCLGVTKTGVDAIATGQTVSKYADPRQGIKTGDNGKFLRLWWEVSKYKIEFNGQPGGIQYHRKWYPIQKGGRLRRWYGNNEFLVNWENDGRSIKNFKDSSGKLRSRPQNLEYKFREGTTWSTLTVADFSMRYCPSGFLSESAGSICYPKNIDDVYYLLSYFNSSTFNYFIRATSPTLSYSEGAVSRAPIIYSRYVDATKIAKEAVSIAKTDWDLRETSWDYVACSLCTIATSDDGVESAYLSHEKACNERMSRMEELEEKNNQIFMELFNLNLNIDSEGYGKRPSLKITNGHDEVLQSVSFAIGCMMGRYSLDQPGLVYAHSGNEGFDESKYESFPADSDGIIPVMDMDWFPDDVAGRFEDFLKVAWSPEMLEKNLKFIADSLSPKGGETTRETIRRYLSTQFFKDHLQTYKKRPIYWLFSSGRQRAFECLVYLHRYNEATLSRMRNEYVTPLQGKLSARMDYLANEIEAAATTSARSKLQKQLEILKKKQAELAAFDDLLRHHADRRISLDLDDGVKVNYGKFGNLLVEVKSITGADE